MTMRASLSTEWLFDHYLKDDDHRASKKLSAPAVVVPAVDVKSSPRNTNSPTRGGDDFAELNHHRRHLDPTHSKRSSPRPYIAAPHHRSSKNHHHAHQYEPLSPVYVKQQQQQPQQREDDNPSDGDHGDTRRQQTTTSSPRSRVRESSPRHSQGGESPSQASPSMLVKAFDDLQKSKQLQKQQQQQQTAAPPPVSATSSFAAPSSSAVSGVSSSIMGSASSVIYRALESPEPSSVTATTTPITASQHGTTARQKPKSSPRHRTSLSIALSEVTEEPLNRHSSKSLSSASSSPPPSSPPAPRTSPTTRQHQHERDWRTMIPLHSMLELCTEDLMSDDVVRVSLALHQIIVLCGTESTNDDSAQQQQQHIMKYTQCGGHAVLVGVMKKFSTHPTILVPACRLVQTIVSTPTCDAASNTGSNGGGSGEQSGGDNSHAFAELFQAVAGLECVLKLLEYKAADHDKHHHHQHQLETDEIAVRSHAAMALTSLLQVGPKFVERFLQMGDYTKLYLKIVQQQRLSTNGVLSRLLYQLSTTNTTTSNNSDGRSLVRQQAVVDLIVAELNQCPDSRSVQVYGCATLGNIFKQLPDLGTNGIPAILRAMKLFSTDEIVLERAITGLYYCCRGVARHIDGLKHHQSGGLSTISLAVECFPKNLVIHSRGSEIIKALLMPSSSSSSSPRNRKTIEGRER